MEYSNSLAPNKVSYKDKNNFKNSKCFIFGEKGRLPNVFQVFFSSEQIDNCKNQSATHRNYNLLNNLM